MELKLWLAGVIPVMAACYLLYIWMKERGYGRQGLLAKCSVTWLILCTAAAGIWQQGGKPWENLLIWPLLAFLAADALLEMVFAAGVASFGVGHLMLLSWMVQMHPPVPTSILIWIMVTGITALGFRKEFGRCLREKRHSLLLLYPMAVAAMLSVAVMLPVLLGAGYLAAAVGAVFFAVSDFMVGKRYFGGISKTADRLALALYYLAILLIACTAF